MSRIWIPRAHASRSSAMSSMSQAQCGADVADRAEMLLGDLDHDPLLRARCRVTVVHVPSPIMEMTLAAPLYGFLCGERNTG
ncbi:hypothetical protein ACFSTC_10190 [Nonomuraea ferruginea]